MSMSKDGTRPLAGQMGDGAYDLKPPPTGMTYDQLVRQCEERVREFEQIGPHLDAGIRQYVRTLYEAGIETFESCQGGDGHSYPEPTVRFHGHRDEGFRALALALQRTLPVSALRRIWPIYDGEPTGPYWEMTFSRIA